MFEGHLRKFQNFDMSTWEPTVSRVFSSRDPGVMLTLLKQLVYPTAEYNSVLWNPSDQSLIDALEDIQRNFTRKIESEKLPRNHDYWDRLRVFKLYSMQRRRERYASFYVCRVIHNEYPNPGLHYNTTTIDHAAHPNQGIQIDAHQRRGFTPTHNVNPPKWLENCSALKTCDLYNCLPVQLRQHVFNDEVPDFSKFKKEVDLWLQRFPTNLHATGVPSCCHKLHPTPTSV